MPRLAPENTLSSFKLAMRAGADGIELDVHATADGVVIVHHDAALPDGQEIASLTLAELRRYEAAPGVPIPTLAEVCDLVQAEVELLVEIKGAGIERAVLATLEPYAGDAAIHSFDHELIQRVASLEPDRRLGILFDVEDPPADIAEAMAATGARDVWPHWSLTSAGLVAQVHEAGGRVISWTVNDRRCARQLAALGVDGLCGDDVRLFAAL